MPRPDSRRRAAFTIIELLTVIAVIGILAAILIPTVSSVRRSAAKAKTKVQFSQWVTAIEGFRSEYGYYPQFDSSNLVNPASQSTVASTEHLFHDILAARRRDGTPLPAFGVGTNGNTPEAQNRKRITFHEFGEGEITGDDDVTPNLIKDAYDNTVIAVLVDRNLDGKIDSNDYPGGIPSVAGMSLTVADYPVTGLRLRVAIYAPGPTATVQNPEFIFSWK